jgi:DNA-directed RNA polymerase subunit RPC12/RpoP
MSRHNYLKRTYGMSEDEYNAQAAYQNYVCAACQSENPVGRDGLTRENLAVDHNHATGENRGLLCQRCNKILGLVRDHPELLLFLLEYLKKYGGSPSPYIPDNPQIRASREAAWEASFSDLPVSEAPRVSP